LLVRGDRTLARQELVKARADPAYRNSALRLLAQVDETVKARKFDFSRLDQTDAWELEGAWTLRGGALIHDDANVGVARLKGLAYKAEGFELALDLTFLESEGMFEVQVGADSEHCVWFTLGSAGYEARSIIGQKTANTRAAWTMRPNEKVPVKCAVRGDVLTVSAGGASLVPLKLNGMGALSGPLTLRAQGLRLALDNVDVRQGE